VGCSVLQLKPRPQSFGAAVDAYRAGQSNDCVTLLHGHSDIRADLLRARAYLRLGRPDLGIASIATINDSELSSNRVRAELLLLRSALQTRVRDLNNAGDALELSRVLVLGAASAALEAEYHYYAGSAAFGVLDLDRCDREAITVLNVEPASFDAGGYFVPLANTRARALLMRGHVAAAREKYGAQLNFVREAISELQRADTPDQWLSAWLLMHLAFHVRDFDLIEDAEMLRREAGDTKWPDELASMKFEIHRALGWSSALRGDHLNAFREFRAMSQCADSPARKILASVDRSYLARELGETHSAQDELEHAAKLASSVNWNEVGEERIGLAQLAQEVAAFDPHHAGVLFARYKELKGRLAPNMLNNVDRRVTAFELLAEGTVLRANGSVPAATQRFMRAFDIWDKLGYKWRAATAALPLAEVLQESRYVDHVRREAASRPNSWLARRAEKLTTRNEPKRQADVRLKCL